MLPEAAKLLDAILAGYPEPVRALVLKRCEDGAAAVTERAGVPAVMFAKANIEAVEKDAGDTGKLRFTLTDDGEDRHGDVIPSDKWSFDNYLKAPIVLFNHEYGEVGGGVPSMGRMLNVTRYSHKHKGVVEFHRKSRFNEELYSAYRDGYMYGGSVGFGITAPLETRDTERGGTGIMFGGQEMFEFSLVAVGANPNALREAVAKGIMRPRTAEYLSLLDPFAGSTLFGAGETSQDAAIGERDGKLNAVAGALHAAALVLNGRIERTKRQWNRTPTP